MANLRQRLVGAIFLAAAMAGCAGPDGVRIVENPASLAPDAQLLDIHNFRLEAHDDARMRQVAREWAKQIGADLVVIRVIDRSAGQLLFSVEAYRAPPAS